VRDIPIFYEERGTGRPLLVLHGWPGDHRMMMPSLEPLFEQRSDWRRLYPDLPGAGKTPGADWIASQDQMLEVTLGFLDAIAPGERFAVAGGSYGGYLARGILHERRAQIDGVFMFVPLIELDSAKRDLPTRQVLVREPDIVAALEPDESFWLEQVSVVQTREMLAAFRTTIKPSLASVDQALEERLEAHPAFSFDVDKLPEPFPAPTLILTGRQDSLCGYREAWRLLDTYPRGTFAVLDRAGHGVAEEQPAVFRALVGEWLDRVEEFSKHKE